MDFKTNTDWVSKQIQFCMHNRIGYVEAPFFMMAGVAGHFDGSQMPVNGLRHPPESFMSGWFLWKGEIFPSEIDAFRPIHIQHILEGHPEIIKFLGMPPGWRFLTAGEYEDVWYDEELLKIDPHDPGDSIFRLFRT